MVVIGFKSSGKFLNNDGGATYANFGGKPTDETGLIGCVVDSRLFSEVLLGAVDCWFTTWLGNALTFGGAITRSGLGPPS